jgi:hypothetical protein
MKAAMPDVLLLHEDCFHEYVRPFRHAEPQHDNCGGYGLETFGDDMDLVRRLDPEHVWTVIEGEFGDQPITPNIWGSAA